MDRFRSFLKIFEALKAKRVEYVLVGGVAVILQGFPRATEDVDIFVKMEPENIKKLKEALMSVYDDAYIDEITFAELERYPVIRYGTPDGFYIDILGRLGEAVTYDDLEIESFEVEGVQIRVATPETLYRLKKDTVRPRDQQDALFLKQLIEKRRSDQQGDDSA
jgi:hypothetical protein